jgi:hypothetical protein
MLIRISLIVAILAGLAAGTLNFIKVKENVQKLQADRNDQRDKKTAALNDAASKLKLLTSTSNTLKTVEGNLATTKRSLDDANKKVVEQTAVARTATESLAKEKADRIAAQQDLAAYKGTQLSPEEIVAMTRSQKGLLSAIDGLKEENGLLGTKLNDVQAQLNRIFHPETPVYLPTTCAGKVLATDPKWNFVVLNFGREQGVLKDGELLVNRAGRLVAKVIVYSIQKDRCIANVVPGWQLGDIFEGDMVIPAHPES